MEVEKEKQARKKRHQTQNYPKTFLPCSTGLQKREEKKKKKNPRLCTLRNRQKVKANKHSICSLIMKTILKVKSGVMKQAVQYSSELALV